MASFITEYTFMRDMRPAYCLMKDQHCGKLPVGKEKSKKDGMNLQLGCRTNIVEGNKSETSLGLVRNHVFRCINYRAEGN